MLFVLTGSSGAGKTTLASLVAGRAGQLPVHDFDEVGVPSDADLAWRHRTFESWLSFDGDLLLSCQSPIGEVLASPSAVRLDGIAICLIDVSDDLRRSRLAGRFPYPPRQVEAFVAWAQWHRGHAADPRYRPEVIRQGGWPQMRWDRWADWTAADPRWHVDIVDTTPNTPTESADMIIDWISAQRKAPDQGTLPLAAGWSTHDEHR
jgi:hypothetical protein